jgi:hypothetical protein
MTGVKRLVGLRQKTKMNSISDGHRKISFATGRSAENLQWFVAACGDAMRSKPTSPIPPLSVMFRPLCDSNSDELMRIVPSKGGEDTALQTEDVVVALFFDPKCTRRDENDDLCICRLFENIVVLLCAGT